MPNSLANLLMLKAIIAVVWQMRWLTNHIVSVILDQLGWVSAIASFKRKNTFANWVQLVPYLVDFSRIKTPLAATDQKRQVSAKRKNPFHLFIS